MRLWPVEYAALTERFGHVSVTAEIRQERSDAIES
jgi:hypothetical protein